MSWRFWPLADVAWLGVLVPTRGKPKVAEFLTPAEAKAQAQRKRAA